MEFGMFLRKVAEIGCHSGKVLYKVCICTHHAEKGAELILGRLW